MSAEHDRDVTCVELPLADELESTGLSVSEGPTSDHAGGQPADGVNEPSSLPTSTEHGNGCFSIYEIKESASGRRYVGFTSQTVVERFTGHHHDASRDKTRRPGSLAHAITKALRSGLRFHDAFSVRCLQTTDDLDEARVLEAAWIMRLETASPNGFNMMPGGSSVGGPLNSRPVTLDDASSYPSLSCAIRSLNQERRLSGRAPLAEGANAVYARLSIGWTVEEALGVATRVDGRRRRTPFEWRGRCYGTLREVSDRSGIPIDTLRSRLHRRGQATGGESRDVAHDRRSANRRGRRDAVLLPAPDGKTVTLREFAARNGIAISTVAHRYAQLVRAGRQPAAMSPNELGAFLTAEQDRRIILQLEVSPKTVWRAGVRELVRRVLDGPDVECRRPERIGASAIRARLRRTPGWPNTVSAADMRWAFGFEVRTSPES